MTDVTDSERRRQNIVLTFRGGDAFLEAYNEQGMGRGIWVPGILNVEIGERVDLEIVFADEVMIFHSRGVVEARQTETAVKRPAGILVAFLRTEQHTRQIILDYAQGLNRTDVQRRQRRYPIRIQVDYTTDIDFITVTTDDLSQNGAFLLSETLLNAGTLIAVRIKPPDGGAPITINAEVAWRQTEPRRGFGIRFLIGDPAKQEEIDGLLERLTDILRQRGDKSKE